MKVEEGVDTSEPYLLSESYQRACMTVAEGVITHTTNNSRKIFKNLLTNSFAEVGLTETSNPLFQCVHLKSVNFL